MSKPSRKKKSGAAPARTAALDSKTLRCVLNGDHPSGIERIDWRGPGADAKEIAYLLDRRQPIDSLRALVIGMLCLAHCRNKRGDELSELGTVTVTKKQGGWEIRKIEPQKRGSNWLQTLANGYEPRPASPIRKLLKALPGLLNEQTRQWIATRADDSGLPRFWCQDYAPSDSSDYGGPNLLFRQVIDGKETADLPDTTDWLALAREIEKGKPAWKPLLQPPRRPELNPVPLKRYFEHLVSECRHLPLIAIDEKATNPEECAKLDLSNIYVELGTQLREKREEPDETLTTKTRAGLHGGDGEALSALRAVAQLDRLALTGSPGSGKTTFTRHFSLCFAQRALQPKAASPKGLKDWPDDAPRFLVPITIELRRFARSLPRKLPQGKQPVPRELWDFFTQTVLADSTSRSGYKLSDLAGLLETAVAEGHAVVF
ncbi:MAG: hypothetical protein HC841_02095, partial [Verrucomicrobiae bacterium]|nr:hypothetical protein [Verrucomicrobiae bacterium]